MTILLWLAKIHGLWLLLDLHGEDAGGGCAGAGMCVGDLDVTIGREGPSFWYLGVEHSRWVRQVRSHGNCGS